MIKLFREKRIEEAFKIVLQNVQHRIDGLSENDILKGDLNHLSENFSNKFQLAKLKIDLSNRDVSTIMTDIPGSSFPLGTDVRRNQYYSCAKVNYTFSIQSGEVELLSVIPSKNSFNHEVVADVNGNQFTIGYQTRYANVNISGQVKEEVKQSIRPIIDSMEQMIDIINTEVNAFNGKLKKDIRDALEKRKSEIQKLNKQNHDLNNL